MKTNKLFMLIGLTALLNIAVQAQVSLPYYTGFDNTPQQTGWVEYKKAATTFSHWGYASFDAYSAPNCVSHDYSPSTGITLTDNWFVSPAFFISSGGILDSVRYKFSGFSQPVADDTIAIYLLNGSQDPALATSKTLLFDFRDAEYITDNVYRIKTGINLPSGGPSYFAIRYRNSDCSSKWLSVSFDNIAINGNDVGIGELNTHTDMINIYPNPATTKVIIESKNIIKSIEIYNLLGEKVYTQKFKQQMSTEINLSNFEEGIYFAEIYSGTTIYTKKIIVQK